MIRLAYCNVENLDLKKAYSSVSKDRQDKIDFYRFEKDKKLSAGAYLLLKKLLSEENITNPLFKTEKYGKAYISNFENVYFNLSHSGKMVLCAISDREVGVDIEYSDPEIDLNIAKLYFYNGEYESIMNSQNPADEFFKYWVLKESYMKYTGLGMNLKLDSFEIKIGDEIKLKNDDEGLKFNLFNVENYKIGIASHYEVSNLIEYDVTEL
ncbi:4'-phosphopantetheinyl transferase family protein [Methanobrevibacter thaueri]|jgi:4'-phosphopantetheinyl transferase|uniref:4'-phosphopantetheinyl transferase sfp n=1 Tax=Methanobrevibacter thaueri TaxID=190975 RepID=A0A315XM16_9EURY|nr:4'-phosphopantetheinyl transferase superfamily protein [Methanobrevibacter thaueri]MBR3197320.1 4'-phosphopantetheinyl transferase superfamily protein [Methanobrevibacter sp.]MBR6927800.1 4'-phosphopantetheinyl transferase superfamily protein [Methanobrevibacter sp.]PWB86776.1 4'-phosphopantetheinyl transferase sfp [Methanobrevibacter thaueri]